MIQFEKRKGVEEQALILEYFQEKTTEKFSLEKCRMIRKEGRRCIRMQAIIAIFILGGIIIPFIMKVIDKTGKTIDKATEGIEPGSVLGKIVGGFVLLLVGAFVIFLAY